MDFFKSPEFRSHVEDLMRQHHVPGLAIAIVQDDQMASAGFGKASIDPPRPCTADTLFDIASSSKSLTAASVALLVDDNEKHPEVQYDAIMSNLLPGDFVMPGAGYTEGVTVDDVLGHRTGMAAHDNSYMGTRAEQPDDARSITRNLRNLPVAAPLRSRYLYCNMMYTTAAYLVEAKSQQSFSDFLDGRIFTPLGMHSTCLQPASARARGFGDRIATGYIREKNGRGGDGSYRGFQSPDCPEGQGAGSVMASVNDFVRWVKALLNREGPISERVYQGLTRMRSFANPSARRLRPYTSPAFYAAGMEVYYYRGHAVVGHDGVIPGFGGKFILLPDLKFGAVVFGNSSGAGPVSAALVRELMDVVLKVPEAEASYKRNPGQGKVKGSLAVRPKDQAQGQSKSQAQPKNKGKKKEKESKTCPRQETPLEAYTGKYWHPGYHAMTVQIKDDKLFVDATDRSMGFTLTFEHAGGQTRYTAHLRDSLEGGDDALAAEFEFEAGVAVRMGLDLEAALRDDRIWFERAAT